MTINTQDLIKVDHPGDASIWTSPPSYSTINGEEVQNFSPLYWEDANDEVISLLDGQGAQLGLQGEKFILSNNTSATCCYYPYEFTGAWLLETNGDKLTDYGLKTFSRMGEPDQELGYDLFITYNRDSVGKGQPGGGANSVIAKGDDEAYVNEERYNYDLNGDGQIGIPSAPEPDTDYKFPLISNTVTGTESKDKLRGKKSSDSILGLSGNDKINGKKGDDILDGGEGNDTLNGKKGDDYLLGAQGSDILTGGKGADVFKTSKGLDVVNDFKLNQGDRVGLNQGTDYEVIDDVDGTLIKVSDDIRMILLDQDYDEFLAAGTDAIARIAV